MTHRSLAEVRSRLEQAVSALPVDATNASELFDRYEEVAIQVLDSEHGNYTPGALEEYLNTYLYLKRLELGLQRLTEADRRRQIQLLLQQVRRCRGQRLAAGDRGDPDRDPGLDRRGQRIFRRRRRHRRDSEVSVWILCRGCGDQRRSRSLHDFRFGLRQPQPEALRPARSCRDFSIGNDAAGRPKGPRRQ